MQEKFNPQETERNPQNVNAGLLESITTRYRNGDPAEHIKESIRDKITYAEMHLEMGLMTEADLQESTRAAREMNDVELAAAIEIAIKIEDQREREYQADLDECFGGDDCPDYDPYQEEMSVRDFLAEETLLDKSLGEAIKAMWGIKTPETTLTDEQEEMCDGLDPAAAHYMMRHYGKTNEDLIREHEEADGIYQDPQDDNSLLDVY